MDHSCVGIGGRTFQHDECVAVHCVLNHVHRLIITHPFEIGLHPECGIFRVDHPVVGNCGDALFGGRVGNDRRTLAINRNDDQHLGTPGQGLLGLTLLHRSVVVGIKNLDLNIRSDFLH